MKNIIKTDNYLLIVSDEEIKEGDWVVNTANNYISFSAEEAKDLNRFTHVKKIIAHLPLNGEGTLWGVDLLRLQQSQREVQVHRGRYEEGLEYGIY